MGFYTMLTLSGSRPLRLGRGVNRDAVAKLTCMDIDRLRAIELEQAEPWYDEALSLSRCYNVPIVALLDTADLDADTLDPRFFPADLRNWSQGLRLPLSTAIRLSRRFGLSTVDDLSSTPLTRQLWSIIEATERHPEASGWCAWCQADVASGASHADTCTPHNLWGMRNMLGHSDELVAGSSRPAEAGKRKGSAKAYGLGTVRAALGLSQEQMARAMGCHPNHYAQVERCALPLTLEKAARLIDSLGVERDAIYRRPV